MDPSVLTDPRPIYVMAHRCNALSAIEEALNEGANAVECDIRFRRPGREVEFVVDHDAIVPGRSPTIEDWLDRATLAAETHKAAFALIYFDIKITTIDAGALVELHRRVRAKLPADLNLVFSTADYKNRAVFSALADTLGDRDGLTLDEESDPAKVERYFADALQVKNFWYGYGTGTLGIRRILPSIQQAVLLRDHRMKIRKVHTWTYKKRSSIEEYIGTHHVDAIIVVPRAIESAVEIARTCGRLATRNDSAFSVHRP